MSEIEKLVKRKIKIEKENKELKEQIRELESRFDFLLSVEECHRCGKKKPTEQVGSYRYCMNCLDEVKRGN